MQIDETRVKILVSIQGKLMRGDISRIAEKVGVTKEYVGMILNPHSKFFREDIVGMAIDLITKREQSTKKLLLKLSAVA